MKDVYGEIRVIQKSKSTFDTTTFRFPLETVFTSPRWLAEDKNQRNPYSRCIAKGKWGK